MVDLEEAIGFLEEESNSNINIKNNDTNVKGDNTTVNDAFDAELDALMNGLEDSSENNAVINDKEWMRRNRRKRKVVIITIRTMQRLLKMNCNLLLMIIIKIIIMT